MPWSTYDPLREPDDFGYIGEGAERFIVFAHQREPVTGVKVWREFKRCKTQEQALALAEDLNSKPEFWPARTLGYRAYRIVELEEPEPDPDEPAKVKQADLEPSKSDPEIASRILQFRLRNVPLPPETEGRASA